MFTTTEDSEKPSIPTASTVMSVIDAASYQLFYTVMTNATLDDESDINSFWTNLQFFNQLNVTWDARYEQQKEYPPRPSYVHEFKFGIVQAEVNMRHLKQDRGKLSPLLSFAAGKVYI